MRRKMHDLLAAGAFSAQTDANLLISISPCLVHIIRDRGKGYDDDMSVYVSICPSVGALFFHFASHKGHEICWLKC